MLLGSFPNTLGVGYKRGHNLKQQFILQKPDLSFNPRWTRNFIKGQIWLASGREDLSIHHYSGRDQEKYLVTGECVDNSKEIIKELVGLKSTKSHDDDEDEGLGNTKDENCEVNEIME